MTGHASPSLPEPSLPEPPGSRAWASGPRVPPPRRSRGLAIGAIALVVALVGAGLAFVLTRGEDRAEAQPLALAFTEGQSETFAIHQTMDGRVEAEALGSQDLQMDMTQVMTWEVRSVDDQGIATISVAISEMSGTVNGIQIPQDQGQMPAIEFQVAPDGRIVSAGGLALGGAGQTQGFGFPGMGQLTPILPDDGQAVAPGDTWEKEFSQEFPFGDGTIEYTARSTYERNDEVGGAQAAVIVTEMTVPLDFTLDFADLIASLGEGAVGVTGAAGLADATMSYGGQGSFTQTSFVDLDARELLKTDTSGDFDLTMAFGGIPGFEGEMAFTGTFAQQLERR
ncbi:MAG TPA: hypothetical protein VE669_05495 [Actinomycetota bacterium]|nr:hypothetical protein [Actinomycetota bacterium]